MSNNRYMTFQGVESKEEKTASQSIPATLHLRQGIPLDSFLDKIRNASPKEIQNCYSEIENVLADIHSSQISVREKNDSFRQLAFTLFNRSEVNSHLKSSNTKLNTLRILIFHQFEETEITAKIFLKAYTHFFQDREEKSSTSTFTRIGYFFSGLCRGMRPMKKSYVPDPIASHLSTKVTTVYTGTGRDFFNLVSKGKLKGYGLDDGCSLGIYVTQVDMKTSASSESFPLEKSELYAYRSAIVSFDYPIYLVLNVPTQHLSHVWINNCNHANIGCEAAIVEKDLEEIRKNRTVGVTAYYYDHFSTDCGQGNPFERRKNTSKEDFGLNEEEYLHLKEFVYANCYKQITLHDGIKTSRHFQFGEAIEEKTELSKGIEPLSAFKK